MTETEHVNHTSDRQVRVQFLNLTVQMYVDGMTENGFTVAKLIIGLEI